jgi:hypothetical protein
MSRADEHFEMEEWLGGCSKQFYNIMIVEFNTGGANFIPVQQATARRADAASTTNDSSVSFSAQTLQDTLKQSSSPRPEKVAQANALLSGGNYPSDVALNQLAGFLANRL